MSLSEKKMINLFKTFIDKVFVPQLHKTDSFCQKEWKKFSGMLSADQLNFGELQLYVDTLPGIDGKGVQELNDVNRNKSPFFMKNRKESQTSTEQPGSFNPSKTFGGEKARMTFPMKDLEQSTTSTDKYSKYSFGKEVGKQKQENSMSSSGFTTQSILPTLERVYKIFSENQSKFQRSTGGVGSPVGTNLELHKQPYKYQ